MSSIQKFISSKGELSLEGDKVKDRIAKSQLYDEYRQYCIDNDIKKLGSTTFHKEFQQMFKLYTIKGVVTIDDLKKQKECYIGIIFKNL